MGIGHASTKLASMNVGFPTSADPGGRGASAPGVTVQSRLNADTNTVFTKA